MSALAPAGYAAWLRAAAALEADGVPVDARAIAARMGERVAGARRMLARLRDRGALTTTGGAAGTTVATYRLAARGRWALGLPVLVYLAGPLDPCEPYAGAEVLIDAAVNMAAALGPPAAPLMPSESVLARAAQGDDYGDPLAQMAEIARRADVVVVVGADQLLEIRADVVAGERADALIVLVRDDEVHQFAMTAPAAAVHLALTNDGPRP